MAFKLGMTVDMRGIINYMLMLILIVIIIKRRRMIIIIILIIMCSFMCMLFLSLEHTAHIQEKHKYSTSLQSNGARSHWLNGRGTNSAQNYFNK